MQKLSVTILGTLPKINAAFFGPGGIGKTTLVAGLTADPRISPCLWVNALGNPELLILQNKIPYGMNISEWQDLNEPLMFLINGQQERDPFRRKMAEWGWPKDLVFRSLVIDTFTTQQKYIIDYIVERKPAKNRAIPDVASVDFKLHGQEIAATTLMLIHKVLVAPVHTFVCYQEYEKVVLVGDEGGTVTNVKTRAELFLYGQSRQLAPSLHNLMGHMALEDVLQADGKKAKQLVIQWRDPSSTGKNQLSPSLGESMIDPTPKDILDAIEGDWAQFIVNQEKQS